MYTFKCREWFKCGSRCYDARQWDSSSNGLVFMAMRQFKETYYSIKRSLSVQKGNQQHFHKLVILREEFWLKIMILPLKVFKHY